MAVLTSNSLDNCSSIPCFLPGGTRMTFNNSTAPTSWTKDTTSHNNKALRLVTGTIAPGGATAFTTVFPDTARPVQGTINSVNSNVTFAQTTISPVTTGLVNAFPTVSIDARALQVTQLPSHTHTYQRAQIDTDQPGTGLDGIRSYIRGLLETVNFSPFGSGASHTHSFPATAQHDHAVQVVAHGHPVTSLGPHTHTFTTTAQNFAVSYEDVIVCQKDTDPVTCVI